LRINTTIAFRAEQHAHRHRSVLTTGDKMKLFRREPDVHFADSMPNALATIDLD